MEDVMKETQRSLRIREKRKVIGDYDIYIACDDPEHEPPLEIAKKINVQANKNKLDNLAKDSLRDQLNQLGFSNALIQNKVLNDPRCSNLDTAIDIYTEYSSRS